MTGANLPPQVPLEQPDPDVLRKAQRGDEQAFSAIVREYAPNGYDGHFVSTKDPTAQADVAHFLADALAGKTPMVGR